MKITQTVDSSLDRIGIKKIVLFVAIVEPLASIPQVYEIYTRKSAQNVAFFTWLLYVLSTLVWLLYGFRIKDRPLIITCSLGILFYALIIFGILLYR
jgi:uncharacterized protein with PQ loop repeat